MFGFIYFSSAAQRLSGSAAQRLSGSKTNSSLLKARLSFEFLFLVISLVTAMLPQVASATPQIIRVDGSIFDNSGVPVTASKDIEIKAYDAASGGSLLWTSSVYNTAVSTGKFTINLDAAAGSPSLVDRFGERTASQAIYFQIEVDSGAANGSMDTPIAVLPRMRARGTAFALTANTADALKGVSATTAEMNYLAGVSANVQTQINSIGGTAAGVSAKVSKAGDSMSGTLQVGANITSTGTVQAATLNSTAATASRFALFDSSKNLASSATTVTDTEFGYLSGITANLAANLNGLTANVQTQINGKQAALAYVPVSKLGDSMSGALQVGAAITSTGTVSAATVNVSGLTASRVALTDGSKNLVSAAVTDVELAFLVGVTAGIQSQLQRFLGQTCSAGYYLTGFDATGTKVCTVLPSINTSLSYTQLATGVYRSCGILSDQTVQCWGYNNYGQLGNSTTTQSAVPVFVYKNNGTKLLATKVILAGNNSTCAIQASDSKVYCWGQNSYGQLGNGTTTNSSVAVPVSTLGAVIDIAGSAESFCAVDSAGKVWCWGYNGYAQLGDGTTTDRNTPTATIATLGPVTGMTNVVGSGAGHACAYSTSNSSIYCWGYNATGQLGDGTTTQASTAVQVVNTLMNTDGAVNISSMAAGGDMYNYYSSTCAVARVGSLTGVSSASSIGTSGTGTAWTNPSNATTSNNSYATVALTSATASVNLEATGFGFSIPSDATVTGIKVEWEKKVNAGTTSFDNRIRIIKGGTMGSTDKSSVTAWGTTDAFSSYGGSSDLWGETWTPADINSSNFGAALSARNTSGTSRTHSVDAVRITVSYISVSGPSYKTYCWGYNAYGQLMDSTTTQQTSPVYASLIGVSSAPLQVMLGGNEACYMPTAGGTIKCMGYNGYGELGNGTTTNSTSAFVDVSAIFGEAGTLSASSLGTACGGHNNTAHFCAVTSTGAAACWGYNGYGQIGNGITGVYEMIPTGVVH